MDLVIFSLILLRFAIYARALFNAPWGGAPGDDFDAGGWGQGQ